MPHFIETIILTSCDKGEIFILRIPLTSSVIQCWFKKLQFPIRLIFAMSINKLQGQTLLHLEDWFSYG